MLDLAPPAGTDIDDRFRAALLRATWPDALLQDQVDAAMLALAGGWNEEARALLTLVFLQQGSSPEWRFSRRALAERTGLWPGVTMPEHEPLVATGFPVSVAIEELREIIRQAPANDALPPSAPIILPVLGPTFREPGPNSKEALLARADEVTSRLSVLPPFLDGGTIANVLRSDDDRLSALPPLAVEEFLGEPVRGLARIFILEMYRRFVVRIIPMLSVKDESILAAIAGLSTAGLGPYFTNVPLLIRNVRDLFALVEAAAEEPQSQAFIEGWTLLLSPNLRRHQMLGLVDEYGDRGMIRALSILLQRSAGSDPTDPPKDIVWKIRDAFLDIGEMQLGGKAQELVALWSPNDPHEWELLSDIRSGDDDAAGAREALTHVLKLDPLRVSALRRAALIDGGERARIFGGFNSAERLALRRSRLTMFRSMANVN